MQSKEFDAQIQRLTGDCAVASAFVSYLGPFNKEFRELLMSRDFYGDCIKLGIPVTQNIEVGAGLVYWACLPGHRRHDTHCTKRLLCLEHENTSSGNP